MAQNPIIYNDGGVHRFSDYVAQIPDFLKAEDDVVVLLQVLSDYINNAYRNIDTVEKFQFNFIAVDSNLTLVQNRVTQFINLLKRSETRGEKILYLSKPQGNPRKPNRPIYVEYIYYDGEIDNISPNIVTATLQDGDKMYIEFTREGQESNSGVYIFDEQTNELLIDPNGTSQDPFNDTPNKPFKTAIGLAPRILEFNVSEISPLRVKKVGSDNNLVYYNVFFNASVTDINDITSVHTLKMDIDGDGIDENILIDYYDMIDTLPSIYDEDFEINFASKCDNFEWGLDYGSGLFYARDLTKYERNSGNVNRDGQNKYVDPLYSPNTSVLNITDIRNVETQRVQVTVVGEHKLSVGDEVSIKKTDNFNSQGNKVTSIISTNRFVVENSGIGMENGGIIISRNLFYSKLVDDPNDFLLKVPYTSFIGDNEFTDNDKIARVKYEFNEMSSLVNTATGVDTVNSTVTTSSTTKLQLGDEVIIRATDGSIIPSGLTDGGVYKIAQLVDNRVIRFNNTLIVTTGSGSFDIYKTGRYFLTNYIDLTENTIRVSNLGNLKVGGVVRITGETSSLTLPSPLVNGATYVIEDVIYDESTPDIKIKLEGVDLIDKGTLNANFDIGMVSPDLNNVGSVKINNLVDSYNGTLTLSTYRGDLISEGEFIRISSVSTTSNLAIASINTESTLWRDTSDLIYYKNDLVVYEGLRYKVIKTHAVPPSNTFNPKNNKNYILDMSDVIERKKVVDINPYMFGMFDVYPLAFDGEVDYGQGFSKLYNDLYIRKDEELGLKYGFEQREFIFDPRTAPPEKLIRNGFMEIINSDEANDAYDGDVTENIKAETVNSKLLYGFNDIDLSITNMTFFNGIVTVTTSSNHLFNTGITVTISGVDQSEYNGSFEIEVTDVNKFTYELDGSPLNPTGSNRSVNYTNNITLPIISITRSGIIATVTTGIDHGYTDVTEVVITGADQSGYNGTFPITVTSPNTFIYEVSGFEITPATTSTEINCTYEVKLNDFINVINQYDPSENGTYVVKKANWVEYDNTKIGDPVVLFTRQNLFDVTDSNPEIANEINQKAIRSLTYIGARIVEVSLFESHLYTTDTIVNINGSVDPIYNGRFEVYDVIDAYKFRYKIKSGVTPSSPAVGKLRCYADQWYKFTISDIEWQKKSSYNKNFIGVSINEISGDGSRVVVSTYSDHGYSVGDQITISDTMESGDPLVFDGTFIINEIIDSTKFSYLGGPVGYKTIGRAFKGYNINENGNRDNVSQLFGEYKFTLESGLTINFIENDIVKLNDQYIGFENGIYRVKKGAKWTRLSDRLVMKIRTATVDAYEDLEYTGIEEDDSPYIYRRYTDTEVNNYIDNNFNGLNQVYKVESIFASNVQFIFEKVDNIDTAGPLHKQFDSKFDYNSIAPRDDMKASFKGIRDMGYPLVEKFERLAYIKDPNVIDYELIEYLARHMGYDITALNEDIEESTVYTTEQEREMALRRAIQNLPQYYALKSTNSGLEMLLLTFGIVGELVTIWTRQENPYGNPNDNDSYDDMIPDYELRGLQYAENTQGKISHFVPTPHFKIQVEIDGNFDNQLLPSDERRIVSQIERFKPINTVFDGISRFLHAKLEAKVKMGQVRTQGKLKAAIGFTELEFGDEYQNDCI